LFARAQRVIPGGVNSPVRSFRAVGGTPYFVARAEGPYVWDVEGHRYIDLVQSYGAIIAGHAHPAIVEAVQEAASGARATARRPSREVLLAEEIVRRVPNCDLVRLVSSGTEATMSAIRVARGFTGRDKVVKFAGNYHGHGDLLLAESGSASRPSVFPDRRALRRARCAIRSSPPTTSCPRSTRQWPASSWNRSRPTWVSSARGPGSWPIFGRNVIGLARSSSSTRSSPVSALGGGCAGAIRCAPDLSSFGKVIGGGLPVGAYGGRADVMSCVAPLGPVYQAGTLSGNPLATAAGLAALELLDNDAYAALEETARRLADGLAKAFSSAGVTLRVATEATLVGLHFGDEDPTDYASARTTTRPRTPARFMPSSTGAWRWRRVRTRCCSRGSRTAVQWWTKSSRWPSRLPVQWGRPQDVERAPDGNPHCDALVLFGITGDLAKKKLFPAVYHMVREGSLPDSIPIVGVASSPWSDDDLRTRARESIIASLGDQPIDEVSSSRSSAA